MSLAACDWPVAYGDCGPCPALDNLSTDEQAVFEGMATEYLWRWTAQQFGLCEVVLRPCKQDCLEGVSTYGTAPSGARWMPTLVGGTWLNIGCGSCGSRCGCQDGATLRFDHVVAGVTEVSINGDVLDEAAYRVDNRRLLVRQDGNRWPYCQDMSKPLGEDNTWAVTYRIGAEVPMGGQIAAGKLACELAKAACGDGSCQLPQRWQTISRQGVTVSAALDTFEGLDEGKTGIWLIDSWVASVMKPPPSFSIASPDLRTAGRRTYSATTPLDVGE